MASDSGDPTNCGATTILAASSYHVIRIDGYSRSLNTQGNRPSFNSDPFRAGGRTWHVIYKPMGSPCCPENTEHISLFLALDDDLADAERFVRRQDLERSEHLKGDCFAVRVHVCIFKGAPPVAVPPPDIHRHLGGLLSGEEGTDVEFRVRGETFAAHRFVLGARSPVFRAELLGPMKEGTATDAVQVEDMEPQVFHGLLTFVYTDAWPETEEEDECVMAQHLLAAADRYDLPRLKLMCQDKLRQRMDASSVASILALAEQHRCPRLKEACFKFLAFSSVAFLEAIASEEFEYLARSCPSVTRELISGLLARDLEKTTLGELCSRIPLFRGL
ncbi:hypothetical protein PVAP13_7KG109800 [Panicum virgatum]|uniref:BTB/POZ and MATH domain-containing protein 1 n=1 Tax=Panicum virgatum TaxID=38727 RepID=A0A8T0QF40_PANVG|nr:hypothetical protein PVAP13_7KG109800 [Panicum virgatum]